MPTGRAVLKTVKTIFQGYNIKGIIICLSFLLTLFIFREPLSEPLRNIRSIELKSFLIYIRIETRDPVRPSPELPKQHDEHQKDRNNVHEGQIVGHWL
jgi:hypothetical protein